MLTYALAMGMVENGTIFEQGDFKYQVMNRDLVKIIGINEEDSVNPNLVFPDSVTYDSHRFSVFGLADSIFMGKDIETVSFPRRFVIGNYSFYGCNKLTNVIFNEFDEYGYVNVDIGIRAFGNCTGLRTIELPKYRVRIEESAFEDSGLSGTLSIYCENDCGDEYLTYFGKRAFANTLIDSLNIVNANLEDSVFINCKNLKGVEFTEVSMRGKDLFAGCDSLKNAKLSYERAYKGCMRNIPNLENVELKYFYGGEAWYNYTTFNYYAVGKSMFSGCGNLRKVTMAESYKVIDVCAFENCRNLSDIRMSEKIRYIYERAFNNCENLSEIGDLPELRQLHEKAFYNTDIRTINFGGEMGYYGKDAIEHLDTIYMRRNTPNATWDNKYYFSDDNFLHTVVVVQPGTLADFQNTHPWDMFWHIYDGTEDTGLENVTEENEDLPAEYFDLNGIPVKEDLLKPGIYVKRQGNRSEKIIIR